VRCCQDGALVEVFCSWGCGVSYKSLPKHVDQQAWAKTLRKLNAHESQRCPCNPNATRVSGKAKAKKKAVVDELMHDWETALLKNHIEILQQQIRFLKKLPSATINSGTELNVAKQIGLLEGSLECTKQFIATITSDEKEREANKLKAAKLVEDERSRLLEDSSRELSAAESLDAGIGHIWTEPTYQNKEEWQKTLDMVINMEEDERTARINQTDEDAVGVFWTEPTEPLPAEREADLERVLREEEAERTLRLTVPADPYDPAVGVFWQDKEIEDDLLKIEKWACTAKLETTERARRLADKDNQIAPRHLERLNRLWPQFTRALRKRFPGRIVQALSKQASVSRVDNSLAPSKAAMKTELSTQACSHSVVPLLRLERQPNAQRRRVHFRTHPQTPLRAPNKRPRECCASHVNAKSRRLEEIPPLPTLRLDDSFSEIDPLALVLDTNDSGGPVSPPSIFTDNDDFLDALDDILLMDTALL